MPIVSQEHLDAQRRNILDAARQCFAAQGIHPTTMPQICRAANLSIGAVYRYFPSKEAIIHAAFQDSMRENLEWAIPAAQQADPALAVRTVLTAAFEMLRDPEAEPSMRFGVMAQGEAMRDETIAKAFAGIYRGLQASFGFILERGQRDGALRPDLDPELLLRLLVCVFEGGRVQQLVDPDFDARRLGELLATLMIVPRARDASSPQPSSGLAINPLP